MRKFISLAASLSALALLSICGAEGVSSSQTRSGGQPAPAAGSARWSGGAPGDTMVPEEITYREEAAGGARLEEALPMLVVLHGKLGRPEIISRAFEGLRTPARVIAPRGAAFGSGYVWWDLAAKDVDPRPFAAASLEAERRLAAFVRRLVRQKPTLGKPVFVGFSQGAIVTYSISVRDPDLLDFAFPLSGTLPLGLEPSAWPAGAPKPTVHAFHGDLDDVVPVSMDRSSVARLRALGLPATLTELPALVHALGPRELAALLPELDAALAREAALPSR